MINLTDRVALVTGSARGIGASIASTLAAQGATVVLSDVVDDLGETTAKELGDAATYKHLDVSSETDWETVVADVVERFGHLDVLVNNAAFIKAAPITMMSLEDYNDVVAVTQTGVFLGMKACAAALSSTGNGSIVNIASVDGLAGTPGFAAYVASKFAVRGLTRVGALEFADLGIRVNSVCPGAVFTEAAEQYIEILGFDLREAAKDAVPLRRAATPQDIANAVAFLASDDSAYCTGSDFVVDGGLTAFVAKGLVPE